MSRLKKSKNHTRLTSGDMYFQQIWKNILGRLPIIFSIISANLSVPKTTGKRERNLSSHYTALNITRGLTYIIYLTIGHFRVAVNLTMKARISAKLFI